LKIQGDVKAFVDISPQRVSMTGAVGSEISSQVTIVPKEGYDFKIIEAAPSKPDNIRVEIQETEKDGRAAFMLKVINLQNKKSRYYDLIRVKTDSKVRPELTINVYGNILEPPSTKVN
jgi:hypothetical protein